MGVKKVVSNYEMANDAAQGSMLSDFDWEGCELMFQSPHIHSSKFHFNQHVKNITLKEWEAKFDIPLSLQF